MSNTMQPPRTAWGNFPDVLIHASESTVKQHPAYKGAKSGDDDAATELVLATFSLDQTMALKCLAASKEPTLVSAHAFEREGINSIPEMFSKQLGKVLQWPVDPDVIQSNVVSHTGADGFWRLARQAEFDGPVQSGCDYVLVDDFVGMGGTLANLKGCIESKVGQVVAAVTLTGKSHSAKLALSPERLNELRKNMQQNLKLGGSNDSLTPSTRLLNQKLGTSPEPRRLTPSEIELLRQSKHEMAQRFPENYARHAAADGHERLAP
jgi:hypothetical protein